MSKNYVQPGEHITITASAAIASGAGVIVGSLLAVALVSLDTGESGSAAIEGVWELENYPTGTAIAAGDPVAFSPVGIVKSANMAATGDLENAAVAVEAAAAGATTVKVKLCPGSGVVRTAT